MTDKDSLWEKIAGKLHGELDGDEENEFNEIMADSSNLNDFDLAKKINIQLTKAASILPANKLKSWDRIEHAIGHYHSIWVVNVMKYAAVILFAFITGYLLKTPASTNKEPHFSEITVPFGQMSQLTLSDGTKIWLNSGTTLRYPEQFAVDCRVVFIEGEAFFDVVKMPDKPFIVKTQDIEVEVLGTSFNLSGYLKDKVSTVTLVEGKVALKNVGDKTITYLSPGQMATKSKNTYKFEIQNVNTEFYSAWKEGKILFDNESLDQIAVKLERWYNVEISFNESHLKSYRFTGTILKNKPVNQIMQALELIAPIKFAYFVNVNGKDRITIYNKK